MANKCGGSFSIDKLENYIIVEFPLLLTYYLFEIMRKIIFFIIVVILIKQVALSQNADYTERGHFLKKVEI
jgi:hypothetical protein